MAFFTESSFPDGAKRNKIFYRSSHTLLDIRPIQLPECRVLRDSIDVFYLPRFIFAENTPTPLENVEPPSF